MYDEQDLVPISALQHLLFCERQWALIHLEQIWQDNHLTMEGNILHERVDNPSSELRNHIKIVRSLRLRSLEFGITGVADVVELHRDETDKWKPYPVEYKRGKPKKDLIDSVQLCAQVLCLEEMMGHAIPEGAFFYGELNRRLVVTIDEELRHITKQLILRLHQLTKAQKTPPAIFEKKCMNCSLFNVCLPNCTNGTKSGVLYLQEISHNIIEKSFYEETT